MKHRLIIDHSIRNYAAYMFDFGSLCQWDHGRVPAWHQYCLFSTPICQERLREEEQMESNRLNLIELEERNLMQEVEAELLQMQERVRERSGDGTSFLAEEKSRMEQQKDRLEAEVWKLSEQLRDQKAQYQEDKAKAQAAIQFHSHKEEVADQLQEQRNSGAAWAVGLVCCFSCLVGTMLMSRIIIIVIILTIITITTRVSRVNI